MVHYNDLKSPFKEKNWENNITQVCIEPCDAHEDPLGYRAVFYLHDEELDEMFTVGASYLVQRESNLSRAGYAAPMTHRAIDLICERTGMALHEKELLEA